MSIVALILAILALFFSAFNFLISIGYVSFVKPQIEKPKIDKYKDYRNESTNLLKARPRV